MAQITVSESFTRSLYAKHFDQPHDWLVSDGSQELELGTLKTSAFVVKPDHAIGKRGKNNLLGLNLGADEVPPFIASKKGTEFKGKRLERFLITPFYPHDKEYYLALSTEQDGDQLLFSAQGGIDIEENWDSLTRINLPLEGPLPSLESITSQIEAPAGAVLTWLKELITFFQKFHFAFLEINPLAVVNGTMLPLDFKARLDSCAVFQLQKEADITAMLEAVQDPGHPAEDAVKKLDSMTDASLKLKLLNPNGRIWPLVAGGGASIIYFDSLVDRGLAEEIAFYGEYSGNPPQDLTHSYAEIIIELLLKSTAANKVLLLAGANANFTDIAATFRGIAQALEEHAQELHDQKVQIIIRRGGPNIGQALANLDALAKRYDLQISLHDATVPLCDVLEEIAV